MLQILCVSLISMCSCSNSYGQIGSNLRTSPTTFAAEACANTPKIPKDENEFFEKHQEELKRILGVEISTYECNRVYYNVLITIKKVKEGNNAKGTFNFNASKSFNTTSDHTTAFKILNDYTLMLVDGGEATGSKNHTDLDLFDEKRLTYEINNVRFKGDNYTITLELTTNSHNTD